MSGKETHGSMPEKAPKVVAFIMASPGQAVDYLAPNMCSGRIAIAYKPDIRSSLGRDLAGTRFDLRNHALQFS